MSRLDDALLRLERAVARLEAAAVLRLAEGDAEKRRLREAAGEVAARIDVALGKVGRVLEGEG